MEGYEIEYKSEIPKKKNQLKAEIVSFLNADGGTIYLGVDDQGNTLKDKVKCYAEWEETLSNWINNAFSSDVHELITVFSNEIPFRILDSVDTSLCKHICPQRYAPDLNSSDKG